MKFITFVMVNDCDEDGGEITSKYIVPVSEIKSIVITPSIHRYPECALWVYTFDRIYTIYNYESELVCKETATKIMNVMRGLDDEEIKVLEVDLNSMI